MTKNKIRIIATATALTALSLISSAAVFAEDVSKTSDAVSVSSKSTKESTTTIKPAKTAKIKKVKKMASADLVKAKRINALSRKVKTLETQVADLQKQTEESKSGTAWSKVYAYGPSLVTTPIIGKQRDDGRDLIINSDPINEDLWLLKLNRKIDNYYEKNNVQYPTRPVVVVGGAIQGIVYNTSRANGNSTSNIDMPMAGLKFFVRANQWVNGVILIDYDKTPDNLPLYALPSGTVSGLHLRTGYITVGNLNRTPFYMSIGQMYAPFGAYYSASPSWRITDPQTAFLGKTEARPLLIGFSTCGTYGSLYAFKGRTSTSSGNSINQWGANLGYSYNGMRSTGWKFDIGAGYINNIADSMGMQNNNYNNGFSGFGSSQLVRTVPAYDLHAMASYKPVSLSVEYIGVTRNFDSKDMTFNGAGAKPKALDVSATYKFDVMGKASYIGIAYDQTWEALALNLPKQSYVAAIGTSLFKNTEQKIEYRHDVNYDSVNDKATGGACFSPVKAGAKNTDAIIGSFRIFF